MFRRQPSSHKKASKRHLGFESLERRELMAADLTTAFPLALQDAPRAALAVSAPAITATFNGYSLSITGTEGADRIILSQVNNRISVANATIASYGAATGKVQLQDIDASLVKSITVNGLGGNDVIRLDSDARGGQAITSGATINGGAGNDKIYGTAAGDTIWGDANNDTIYAGGGVDRVYGGTGNDKAYGGDGGDWIYGEAGNDKLYGEAGDDFVRGAEGNDFISGGEGKDTLTDNYGGYGFNTYEDVFDLSKPFINGPKPGDIDQEKSPNVRETLAALSAAADQGFDFTKVIKYRGNGKYDVTLYDDGKKVTERVVFDGTWTDNDPSPGDKTNRLEPWVIIMQRARLEMLGVKSSEYSKNLSDTKWDKLHDRSGGRLFNMEDALETFTGRNAKYHKMSSADPAALRKALKDGKMIVTSTPDGSGKKTVDAKTGIVGQHAYAVINVFKEGSKWMVKLYNPWAKDFGKGGPTVAAEDNDGFVTFSWKTFTKNFEDYCVA